MADVWFRKFGFSRNPFTIKPVPFSYDLVGSGVDGVLSGIEQGKVVFVEAPLGYGKTTLLKNIINRYGGKKKVVYAHALVSEKLDVKGLLKRSSFANYITGNLPRGMILVVDESQNVQQDSVDEVEEFYKNGNLKSVVFFGARHEKGLFNSMGDGNTVIRLSKPTAEQAISMVRGRIGNIHLLSNDEILLAYRKARGSPRRLLQICEDLCRRAAEGGSMAIAALQEVESQSMSSQEPELSQPVGEIHSTSELPSAIEPVIEPKVKVRRARREKIKPVAAVKSAEAAVIKPARRLAKARKPAVPKVPKPVASSKKSSKAAPAVKLAKKSQMAKPEEAAHEQEGTYWGEFMGMQK